MTLAGSLTYPSFHPLHQQSLQQYIECAADDHVAELRSESADQARLNELLDQYEAARKVHDMDTLDAVCDEIDSFTHSLRS